MDGIKLAMTLLFGCSTGEGRVIKDKESERICPAGDSYHLFTMPLTGVSYDFNRSSAHWRFNSYYVDACDNRVQKRDF